MTLGLAQRQGSLLDEVSRFCGEHLDEGSVFSLLARERDRLFPDELFADLYEDVGRRSKPPSVLACLTVLQRLFGLSDRETVERFTYDARFRYATGVGDWTADLVSMTHTVLVRFRMRLEQSEDPKRIFRVTTDVAADAGLLGVSRVLDSAPLHDAVATQDTVTLIRAAIRGLLKAADAGLEGELRAVLGRDDDYVKAGKPPCDWDDAEARGVLIDELACDAVAALGVVDGRELDDAVSEAAELLARVVGQDLEGDDDGRFRIRWGVAEDRVISTVDPDARHGHKSTAGKFDGFKGHIAIDPDAEVVTATAVGPANGGDAAMTRQLTDDLDGVDDPPRADAEGDAAEADGARDRHGDQTDAGDSAESAADHDGNDDRGGSPRVFGDAAYGSGQNLADLADRGVDAMVKVQPASNRHGKFTKDDFVIDTDRHTVVCPAGQAVGYTPATDGSATARFGKLCGSCPLRADCTDATAGRTISIGPHEQHLAAARARQTDPGWVGDYRATRPKVERKLAHMLRAGRRARRRGISKVDLDWSLRAAGANLARFATLGLHAGPSGWHTAPAAA
jgi:hypothetical protein